MSNRKKPRNRKIIAQRALEKIDIPKDEKTVLKRVPANIRWADVGNIDRDDVEVIGESIIYNDGTYDLIVNEDISDDARVLLYGVTGTLENLSIHQED